MRQIGPMFIVIIRPVCGLKPILNSPLPGSAEVLGGASKIWKRGLPGRSRISATEAWCTGGRITRSWAGSNSYFDVNRFAGRLKRHDVDGVVVRLAVHRDRGHGSYFRVTATGGLVIGRFITIGAGTVR